MLTKTKQTCKKKKYSCHFQTITTRNNTDNVYCVPFAILMTTVLGLPAGLLQRRQNRWRFAGLHRSHATRAPRAAAAADSRARTASRTYRDRPNSIQAIPLSDKKKRNSQSIGTIRNTHVHTKLLAQQ